jgi:lysozyme
VTRATEPITEPLASHLLRHGMALIWGGVQGMVRVPLTQGQADALMLLAYNIGETRFRTSTLLRKLNARDYVAASAEFQKWNKITGKDGVKRVDAGLVKRRRLERRIFDGTQHDI